MAGITQGGGVPLSQLEDIFLKLAGGTMVDSAIVYYGGNLSYRQGSTTQISDVISVGALSAGVAITPVNIQLAIADSSSGLNAALDLSVSGNIALYASKDIILNAGFVQRHQYETGNLTFDINHDTSALTYKGTGVLPPNVTGVLPSTPIEGKTYMIKHSGASTKPSLTISGNGKTIDGATEITLLPGESTILIFNTADDNWEIIVRP